MRRGLSAGLLAVAVGTGTSAAHLRGQDQAGAKLTFEVASVKPNTATAGPQGVRVLPSGLLTATRIPVRNLIGTGWGSDAIQRAAQIVGGPAWIDTDFYDISAKSSVTLAGNDGDFQNLQAMVRALLEDRFKAKVHIEMRDVPVYALVLANKEPKFGTLFKKSTASCYTREDPPPRDGQPDPARLCGVRGGNGNVTYVHVPMDTVARSLANYPVVGRYVINRTGLEGDYDLHMEFIPAFVDSPTRDGSQVANPAADSGPNLFTALVEQAGLKLQGERASIQFIVIDGIERPTSD